MVKKLSVLALAGLFVLPAVSMASGGPNVQDLERKIEELSRQLEELKAAMGKQAEVDKATSAQLEDLSDSFDDFDERAEDWDLASRFKLYGDFRARYDYYNADTVFGRELKNDSLWTNRFRLNMRVKATENVEFKGRLAMYKTWGMQSAWSDDSGEIRPVFDGNVTRTPIGDSALYVDRAIVNWNNIGGAPVWFSIGRRPTTDGPPSQVRLGTDERLATPVAFFNYAFDGFTLGYGYNWSNEALGSGKFRFCYGRGFEDGLLQDNRINDTDFAGFNWDIAHKGTRLINLQAFGVFNAFNYPNFQDVLTNATIGDATGFGDRLNIGNLFHTDAVYQDQIANWRYFISGGWSQTKPNGNGMFNDLPAMMMGLSGPNTDDENGYALYAGVRYDFDNIGFKLGAEWNYGSEYWVAFTPAYDDIYQSKLATRGNVFEIYSIYDIPAGEAISKYGRAFIRLGYQHYEYDYSGSGDWNVKPYDLGNAQDLMALQMLGMDPVESADQIYLTFEVFF
ncbi:MAG: DUF3373 domain-containing protein [Desulfobacterales bacterium]|nr:DUF3373 domain-containing protein [Deltaproteobacteria bacterium]MBT8359502.1 DUF3373 domain-containing protein [Deltaproteobacteria bacterium]NNK94761.1 DUF3373 domain-containing protein [Desulfobacterales bacterium]